MKYDSSMKPFRNDIIAVLRYMLKDDKEIAEKFSPEDGSLAPLRDYLKNRYGKIRASHIGDGMRYSCNFSKGLELTFDIILNNPGDKNLTLSWSQTAKFIRDNRDEVFKKSETVEQPSPQYPTLTSCGRDTRRSTRATSGSKPFTARPSFLTATA